MENRCVFCERDSSVVPIISMQYRGSTLAICPQHLPVLIHNPSELIGRIDGAETFRPSEHQD